MSGQPITEQGSAFHIRYGGQVIPCQVLYKARKTMEIAVHPDGQVVITAPLSAEMEMIQDRVRKRVRWITRQIIYFQQFQPHTPPRRYVGGETHLYLGRQYQLKLLQDDKDEVKLIQGRFLITSRNSPKPDKARQLLEQWYLLKAREKYAEILASRLPEFRRFGCKEPRLQIRQMKTRWGSLSPGGVLTLNRDLIRAPRECIDYVVTHELCHLKYKDHSTAFYKLLEQLLPDWEKRKHRLECMLV
ncbi:M48 family metallopeptidase [Thiolapillus sp.]|uniref:M48 family metallopeptidase n=1 Tax=Thiolapillus sp. TaxID=2017437 RepID=UPI0025E8FD65|nr:SprT family zinc-dependent metalloprotease [Thiolapillus sp.]